jgi:hypothetical protein
MPQAVGKRDIFVAQAESEWSSETEVGAGGVGAVNRRSGSVRCEVEAMV